MRWRTVALAVSVVLFAAHASSARPAVGSAAPRDAQRVAVSDTEWKAWRGAAGGVVTVLAVFGIVSFFMGRRSRRDDDEGAFPLLRYVAIDPAGRTPEIDPTVAPSMVHASLALLAARDPSLTFESIESRVRRMSAILREARCAGDMRGARPFVSDGVYGRFQAQLALMRGEGRRYARKGDPLVFDVELEEVETAPPLDVVHVRLRTRARDAEIACDASPAAIDRALEAAASETHEEIWSLVRRQGATTRRDASAIDRACATCGAAILDAQGGDDAGAGEMIKCRYCGVLLCSGEHDWVLSQITQLSAWHPAWPEPAGFDALRAHDPELSRAVLEDRGAYLFWKWIEAGRLASLAPLRKFATPWFVRASAALDAISELRDVTTSGVDLVGLERDDGASAARAVNVAHVKVFWSARFQGAVASPEASVPMQSVLRLVRKAGVLARASMTALACARCGAAIGESDTPTCDHCGAEVTAGDDAWVLDGVEVTGASAS